MSLMLLGVGLALAGGEPCDDAKKTSEAAAELKAMFEQDKADHEANVDKIEKIDAKRAKDAEKLLPYACTGETRFQVASLMSRSKDSEALEIAHNTAKASMMDHIHEAPWLTAVTYDRWQVSRGIDQRYATQLATQAGKTCLYPVAPDSTDHERKTYGLPPLADAFRRVLDANGFDREPNNEATVRLKGLWCDLKGW